MELPPDPTAIFFDAALLGDLQRFKKALGRTHGVGIAAIIENTRDDEGKCALHGAAAGGSVEVLNYLIEEIKFDINVKDGRGNTPLCWEAVEGRSAAVDYLLQMGGNPEIPDDSNCIPLHHAALNGHKDVVPLLLSKGSNVDVTNEIGSPLLFAAAHGHHDIVKLLLGHGASPNLIVRDAFTALHSSIRSQSRQCVVSLLKAGADPNGGPDGNLLNVAAEVGALQIIKLLVEAGADPNVTDELRLLPIEVAAVKDNRRGVEILFPLTSPIPSFVDWSINGIMKHVNSEKFKIKMICISNENFLVAKSRGTSAFHRKEYLLAVSLF